MFCYSCWTLLPDGAPFCYKCGKPQEFVPRVSEPQWETCEIIYAASDTTLFPTKFHFRAKAMGPEGIYTAGRSQEFGSLFSGRFELPDERYDDAYAALEELIQELARDGWRILPTRGPAWYSYRFRRQLN